MIYINPVNYWELLYLPTIQDNQYPSHLYGRFNDYRKGNVEEIFT